MPTTAGDAALAGKLRAAIARLTSGQAQATDGKLTIVNVCAEAGVSRASFYRSPAAAEIKTALANAPAAPEPGTAEDLRGQITGLKRAAKTSRSEHAAEIRRLNEQLKTYANQIQLLALHAEQLRDENQQLRQRPDNTAGTITPLNPRRGRQASAQAQAPDGELAAPADQATIPAPQPGLPPGCLASPHTMPAPTQTTQSAAAMRHHTARTSPGTMRHHQGGHPRQLT